jgi:hypothetical protein
MLTTKYTHPDHVTTYTVTCLQKGECKGWQDDRYVSHGPSAVVVTEQEGDWQWKEYDFPSYEVDELLLRLGDLNWEGKTVS